MIANRLPLYFMMILFVSLLTYAHRANSGSPAPTTVAIEEQNATNDTGWLAAPATPSCAAPTADNEAACRQLEEQILASTVRIDWYINEEKGQDDRPDRFRVGVGYGTIKDGRYLITHNHFDEALQALLDPQNVGRTRLALYKADGEPLFVWRAPLTAVTVIPISEETLLLDFGQSRLFDIWRMPSAEFASWESVSLEPGMEVARVNWDGEKAFVDWVRIEEVITGDGTARIELSGPIKLGASGGGVFYDGVHIGNNWSVVTHRDKNSGTINRQYSKVALNPPEVVSLPLE